MDYLKKVIKSVIPPDDHYVLWIDISTGDNPVAKLYLNDEWVPIIADKLVRNPIIFLDGKAVLGSNGNITDDPACKVAVVDIQDARRIWFLGYIQNRNLCYGYAFYDINDNVITSYCWPSDEFKYEVSKLYTVVPPNAKTFKATIYDGITTENFFCVSSELYDDYFPDYVTKAAVGISSIEYDPVTGFLTIYLTDGNSYTTESIKGREPVLTADSQGNIYSDGVLLTDAIPRALNFATREDILALFYGIAANCFDGTVLVLGTGNYFDGSAIVFTDTTIFDNNTINLA